MNISIRKDSQDFREIFLNDIPLMDVRAPVEFKQGAFPKVENIPLLNDQQRALIGTRYKEAGQDEAIKLGLTLATEELKAERLQQWSQFCEDNPEGYLYCFRGGLRSKTTQQWLKQNGIDYPLVKGGYKAMRGFLFEQFEQNIKTLPLLLLSGSTGSGKTKLLKTLPYAVDIESYAGHRGSAFGGLLNSQPSQIDWENKVSIELLKHKENYSKAVSILFEDEGRLIGRISLPKYLQTAMKQAKLIILKRELEERVNLIREDYIELQWPLYQNLFGSLAMEKFTEFVLSNLGRIRKRLGGLRHQEIEGVFKNALLRLETNNDASGFNEGICRLLKEYYDPMYHYQLGKRQGKVLFSGNETEILQWLKAYQENHQGQDQ